MEKINVRGKQLDEIADTEVTEETFDELTGGKGENE